MSKIKVGTLFTICFAIIGLLGVNAVNAQYGGGGFYVDTTPPKISNIKVAASANTATITWTTDKSSISWAVYGTTTDYGLEVKTTTYVTSHSVSLSDLSPETTYHYSVKAKDSAGNMSSYADRTFTTLAEGEKEVVVDEVDEGLILDKPIKEMSLKELEETRVKMMRMLIEIITKLIALLQQRLTGLLS